MVQFTLPVYINAPLDLGTLITAARSVRAGCIIAQCQDRIVLRSRLSEAQNHRCCWCGDAFSDLPNTTRSPTLEHVIPLSQGGADHPDNMAVACVRCNQKRGTKGVDAFLAHATALGWRHPRCR